MSDDSPGHSRGPGREAGPRFPRTGEIFADRYRVESLLGTGGYARVYRALQVDLDRRVAIKVLDPLIRGEDQTDPESVDVVPVRFEREAKVISELNSSYTITVHEYGRTDDGLLYMVLEYVDGITLAQADVPMASERVARILRQTLESLREAHAAGLLHRDLKPANIMLYEHLGRSDQVKVLDFGIAKQLVEEEGDPGSRTTVQNLTGENTLIGTPRYLAPEQVRGEEVGPARDIYSIGLIAYELIVGRQAVRAEKSVDILARHASDEPIVVPEGTGGDPELIRIVDKMLAKDRRERYADVESVIEELERYRQGQPVEAGGVGRRDSAEIETRVDLSTVESAGRGSEAAERTGPEGTQLIEGSVDVPKSSLRGGQQTEKLSTVDGAGGAGGVESEEPAGEDPEWLTPLLTAAIVGLSVFISAVVCAFPAYLWYDRGGGRAMVTGTAAEEPSPEEASGATEPSEMKEPSAAEGSAGAVEVRKKAPEREESEAVESGQEESAQAKGDGDRRRAEASAGRAARAAGSAEARAAPAEGPEGGAEEATEGAESREATDAGDATDRDVASADTEDVAPSPGRFLRGVEVTATAASCHPADVKNTIRAADEALGGCYAEHFADHSSVEGDVMLDWNILTSGMNMGTSVALTRLEHDGVEGCLVRVVEGLSFEPPDGRRCYVRATLSFGH
jgi:serine/threonine protein kinase